jgi:lipopolysaccharide/colanic/teichoic acid biosynthesis glycosyltransferase
MKATDRLLKRAFDLVVSLVGLILLSPVILACWLVATIETRSNGFFFQNRVGRDGKLFRCVKVKSMYNSKGPRSTITVKGTSYITRSGKLLRRYKLDELPQLFNVLIGNMSFVGPRPDVPGYADKLEGDDRVVLRLRPGITGPASLKYHNEEEILAKVEDPKAYNDTVIWPDKVAINKDYFRNYSFLRDLAYIFRTVAG